MQNEVGFCHNDETVEKGREVGRGKRHLMTKLQNNKPLTYTTKNTRGPGSCALLTIGLHWHSLINELSVTDTEVLAKRKSELSQQESNQ